MKRFFNWLDRKTFPIPTPVEYMRATLETAELELAKALNDADYANSQIAYRSAQIERIKTTLDGVPASFKLKG